MPFTPSIGDVVLLAQLAYRLGQVFTSGRKSAPAEFHEIQNQLYSISKALDVLTASDPEIVIAEQDETLGKMVSNCRESLSHLESVVEKYTDIECPADGSGAPTRRRWRRTMVENWTKVKWTTQGGDLKELRSNLAMHVTSLNLAVSAITSTQTHRVDQRTEDVQQMLKDIYDWFTQNLQHSRSRPTPQEPECAPGIEFSVRMEVPNDAQPVLLCPKAALRLDCLEKGKPVGSMLLECRCQQDSRPHAADLALLVLITSFIVRIATQKQIWQVFLESQTLGKTVSVILTGLVPSKTAEFESFINVFALAQGVESARRGVQSMMAYLDMSEDGEQVMCVLNMKRKTNKLRGQIRAISFKPTNHGSQLVCDSIESIQLLHYMLLPLSAFQDNVGRERQILRHSRHAEIVCSVNSRGHNPEQPLRYIVQIDYNTSVKLRSGSLVFCIDGARCIEETAETLHDIKADVGVEFETLSAAQDFAESVHMMQGELLVSYLRAPRFSEEILFQRPMGTWTVDNFNLIDTTAIGVRDPVNGEERVIIVGSSGSLSVCMKCRSSEDFIVRSPTLSMTEPASGAFHSLETFVVEIGPDRTKIIELEDRNSSVLLRSGYSK